MKYLVFALVSPLFGLALTASAAFAEQNKFEKQLVGTWTLVSTANTDGTGAKVEPFGPHPVGAIMFDANGNVLQVITPGEQGAAKGIVATFGKYSVTDDGKTLTIHFIASNPPSAEGTDSKRGIASLTDDEFKIHNTNAESGGAVSTADALWRRAK
jgi:hypothetical protein